MKKIMFLFLLVLLFVSCKTGDSQNEVVIKKPQKNIQYKKYKRIDDPKLNSIVISAWNNYRLGKYERAALDFERLYKKGYIHYDILFGAAVSYKKYYDLKKSLFYFNLAIKAKPDHFEALYHRGILLSELKNYSASKKDFSKLLAIKVAEKVICGYYLKDYADQKDLNERQKEIVESLYNQI